jgi:uncharacterized membrane protein YozB (DUF420 family)
MDFDVMVLPRVNATLNGIAAILLIIGYVLIRQGRWKAHRNVMLTAFGVSILFLCSYVTYHTIRGAAVTEFGGKQVLLIWTYRLILISHVILAAIVPVLAIITLSRGLRKRFVRHKAIARWTYPIWMYVSITGVLVYLMLYEWFPQG